MLQSKNIVWLNEYKNRMHIKVACKRLTSNIKTHRLKVRKWKKEFHANRNQKKTRAAWFISDETYFKIKTVTRDKEGLNIVIKGSIQEEDHNNCKINIQPTSEYLNTYSKYWDMKGRNDRHTISIGGFNSPLTSVDRSMGEKINKETLALKDTLN